MSSPKLLRITTVPISLKTLLKGQHRFMSQKGFDVLVGDWLRSDLRSEFLSYIDKLFFLKQNIFNREAVTELVLNHLDSRVHNTSKV